MSSAASLRSPRGAPRKQQQTASGYPIGKVLPVSQRRAGKDNGSNAQCCRPSQRPRRGYPFRVPTAPPLALAAPAPHPRTTAAAAAGRAFPLGRLMRPGHRAGRARTRSAAQPLPSLHDPRHRSCTGSRLLAALPALDALRHCSGKAAAAGSSQRLRTIRKRPPCPALILRITWLQLYAIASNCRAAAPHSYNSCYAHNRAGQASGQSAGKGYELQRQSCCSCPQRSGPQLLHAAAAARAGLRSVVGGISARSCCTLLQQHGPGKAGRRPRAPRRPRPPAHPAQAAAKPGLSAWLSLLLQHRKNPTG